MSEENVGVILAKGLDELDSKLVTVNENLLIMGRSITQVQGEVEEVSKLATETKNEIGQLVEKFDAFVQKDQKDKAFQMAQTRIIEVNQDFEKRFGQYDEVRKLTSGILQATDLEIVRSDTIKRLSEEKMLTNSGYWLCPGLIALSAWLSNDRPLAERAMVATVKRDDNKASLYFALISRRF